MLNGRVAARRGRSVSALGFTDADVRAAAGQQSFRRGLSYLNAVTSLEIFGSHVIASVHGSDDYLVVLTLGDKSAGGARPRAECGCRYGQEGFFCKHCVAVALTLLRDAASVPAQRSRRAPNQGGSGSADLSEFASADQLRAAAGNPDVGSWLGALSREELIAIVCEQAIEDDEWRYRLELRAAAAAADVAGVMARSADLLLPGDEDGGLTGPYGYLEGQECLRYARRIEDVAAATADLLGAGHAADAALIAEQALAAIADVSRHASDRAGVIADAAELLVTVHARALRAAAVDPVGLAEP
jgi:SWIM zinc finger